VPTYKGRRSIRSTQLKDASNLMFCGINDRAPPGALNDKSLSILGFHLCSFNSTAINRVLRAAALEKERTDRWKNCFFAGRMVLVSASSPTLCGDIVGNRRRHARGYSIRAESNS
jgi:hypothetical protein